MITIAVSIKKHGLRDNIFNKSWTIAVANKSLIFNKLQNNTEPIARHFDRLKMYFLDKWFVLYETPSAD